jgi:hypothetical protein
MSAVLFASVSFPRTYGFTNNLLTKNSNLIYDPINNCQTTTGHLIHTLAFFLISFLQMFMGKGDDTNYDVGIKLKHAIYGTLIFFIISSQSMYKITGMISNKIADENGCPTIIGVAVHSLVYTMALIGVMYLPDYCK